MKTRMLSILLLFTLTSCLGHKGPLTFKEHQKPLSEAPEVRTEEPKPCPPHEEHRVGFADLQKRILARCVGCHKGMATEEGILKRIKPGDPEGSAFFRSVESGRMPKGAPPLTTEELELVRTYIKNLKPAPPEPAKLAFQDLKMRILEPYQCLTCHKRMEDEATLVKRWIDPAQPENSKLYLRTLDGSMPMDGDALSEVDQKFVLEFIKSVVQK